MSSLLHHFLFFFCIISSSIFFCYTPIQQRNWNKILLLFFLIAQVCRRERDLSSAAVTPPPGYIATPSFLSFPYEFTRGRWQFLSGEKFYQIKEESCKRTCAIYGFANTCGYIFIGEIPGKGDPLFAGEPALIGPHANSIKTTRLSF